ncbi:hypothetical protein V8G54_026594 [Vigna mungo]|uniref:Uncharacterized protein n=1 Tax=Vigna mungo TaxID=3915 RepID=A0AAQ3MZ13_VIGMU
MADSNTSSTQTSPHSSVKDDRICLDSGKRGSSKVEFSEDEETLIIRMYKLVGKRWSLIAGRIPGRTADEIEKYWTSRLSSSRSYSDSKDGKPFIFPRQRDGVHGTSTMMRAMARSNIMEIIMHFLDFFCKLFAVWRASLPSLT